HPRPVVGGDHARPRHLRRQPRLQSPRRRAARRARPQAAMSETLLTVEDLRVRFPGPHGVTEAVRGVSFEVGREKLGIVGESGSGKSVTGRSILRLVSHPGIVTAKRLSFRDTDILTASERTLREIRGRRIAMVMQDPKFSLN